MGNEIKVKMSKQTSKKPKRNLDPKNSQTITTTKIEDLFTFNAIIMRFSKAV